MGKPFLELSAVNENIKKLQNYLNKNDIDASYISSFDPYLNEYVPMEQCHRYYFSGFSGSVAEMLIPKEGKAILYVDGRYWEQADEQVDLSTVEVNKVPGNTTLFAALLDDIESKKLKKIGYESSRTSYSQFLKLKTLSNLVDIDSDLASQVDFKSLPKLNPIKHIEKKYVGNTTEEKLARIFDGNKNEAYFVTSIDSLAWVTNCRGYHLPNLSSFLGAALVTSNKVSVLIEDNIELDCSTDNNSSIEFIKYNQDNFGEKLKSVCSGNWDKINVDLSMLNAKYFSMLETIFGSQKLNNTPGGLVKFHSIKTAQEMVEIEESFRRGDKAIYNTLCNIKARVLNGDSVSEMDLYNQTSICYKEQGAVEQSFNTIAGVGANGSIIHYGDPKDSVKIKKNDMILLDSGGYFEGGFATDTTRTFTVQAEDINPDYKKMYTLVLKGTLNCQNAVFPEGTAGKVLDGFARAPIYQAGENFNHGTGHGVGVHVHEGGVRISPLSDAPMKEGQVVSIEPGIYTPGFGGVRIENIAYVEAHPEFKGFLRFRPLVYIGFEPALIDESMLNSDEKKWLDEYENECTKRGTSFRN